METFNRVKEIREKRGMKAKVLAAQVGLARSTMSKIENNNRKISGDEAIRIAQILNVSNEELYTEKPPAPNEGEAGNIVPLHLREALIWLKETDPNKIAALKKLHLLSKELPPAALDQLASALSQLLSPLPDPDAVDNKRSR